MKRLIAVAALCLAAVACVPPIPYRGPIPVPIPSVTPTEVCQHSAVPGFRYQLTIPQRGVWSFDWRDSVGNWHSNPTPIVLEVGWSYQFDTAFPFHMTWSPSTKPGTQWFVVSPDITPGPAAPCPDY